jgi:ubiquinone/menaquinone biosynthesis C-methylase UbiE
MAKQARAQYGIDAPAAFGGLMAAAFVVPFVMLLSFLGQWSSRWLLLVGAAYAAGSAASYAYTTTRGKFVVWNRELDALALTGRERVLDLGCGRGAVLIMVAKRLTKGTATGVDIWRGQDQSGNSERSARSNAEAEGVADRVKLVTSDLRELSLPDGMADLVVSSLVFHNIVSKDERAAAISHAYRVLTPGGRLRIADFRHIGEYTAILTTLGAQDVAARRLGWRFWYGAPWFGTSMITATKPLP